MTIHRNHRIVWPMVRNHRKTLKAMVEKSKTIEKPLMAMVRPPKNIQWWWSPQKPLEICNGLFKTIEIYNYCKSKCWETFSLLYCVIFTLKWCKESIYMVHIKWTLWILIYVVCKKYVFCCKLILKALFRFNGTSKPSLTIALKILKTIEKPLIPMVGPSKNIQWWWSNVVKTIEKPLKSMVAWKKTLTIPSLWKIDHRHGLAPTERKPFFLWGVP